MKIVVFELEEWERPLFEEIAANHDVALVDRALTAKNAAEYEDAEIISTFIYSKFDDSVMEALPNLKMIATRSTGFDHIPIETCQDRGITVANVPRYGENTVAEHVFGLLLTISHNLEQAIDRTRKGDFSPKGLQGFDLQGKTFGVVGTGDIGLAAIRIAKGFEMEVIAYDVQPDTEAAKKRGFDYVSMDDLLARSDIITLHVPATKATEGLIGEGEFRRMKEGVVIINTARGPIINTKALLRALAEGKVAAAGLDVLPEEPTIREEAELLRSVYEERHNLDTLLANHVLVHMRNVVVTPHSAFNTKEAVQRIIETTIDNIGAFLQGHPENDVTGG